MVVSFLCIFLPRAPRKSVRVPARLSTSEFVRLIAIRVLGHKLFSALCPSYGLVVDEKRKGNDRSKGLRERTTDHVIQLCRKQRALPRTCREIPGCQRDGLFGADESDLFSVPSVPQKQAALEDGAACFSACQGPDDGRQGAFGTATHGRVFH